MEDNLFFLDNRMEDNLVVGAPKLRKISNIQSAVGPLNVTIGIGDGCPKTLIIYNE